MMLIFIRYVTIKINCVLPYETSNFLGLHKNDAPAAKINWACTILENLWIDQHEGNDDRMMMMITDHRL